MDNRPLRVCSAVVLRAARACRHEASSLPADGGDAPGRAVLAQGRVLYRLRTRHDRPWCVGGRRGRVQPRRRRRGVVIGVPSGRVPPGCTTPAVARWPSTSSTCPAMCWPAVSWPPPAEVAVTVYGGAIYASIDAVPSGCRWTVALPGLIALGREVKWALDATEHAARSTGSAGSTARSFTRTSAATAVGCASATSPCSPTVR
jgi:hypothetical protein